MIKPYKQLIEEGEVMLSDMIAEKAGLVGGQDEWNEADHPRGQPGNAGQFGPGGGGEQAEKSKKEPRKKKVKEHIGKASITGTAKERGLIRGLIEEEKDPYARRQHLYDLVESYQKSAVKAGKKSWKKADEFNEQLNKILNQMIRDPSLPHRHEPGSWADKIEQTVELDSDVATRGANYGNLLTQLRKLKVADLKNVAGEFTGLWGTFKNKEDAIVAIDRQRQYLMHHKKIEKERAELPLKAEKIRQIGRQIAEEHGYPGNANLSVTTERRTFMLNGKEKVYGGHYEPWSGNIVLYAASISEHSAKEITAHEVSHDKWEKARRAYHDELRGIPGSWLKPDGSVKEEFAKHSELQDYIAMHEAFFNIPPSVFAMSDGITEYSQEYWEGYYSGENNYDTAVNETLAEIAATRQRNRKEGESLAQTKIPEPYGSRLIKYRNLSKENTELAERDWGAYMDFEKQSQSAWTKLFETVERIYPKQLEKERKLKEDWDKIAPDKVDEDD